MRPFLPEVSPVLRVLHPEGRSGKKTGAARFGVEGGSDGGQSRERHWAFYRASDPQQRPDG